MNNAMKTGQKTDYDRFDELRRSIGDYESLKHTIKTGLQDREKVARQKERINEAARRFRRTMERL